MTILRIQCRLPTFHVRIVSSCLFFCPNIFHQLQNYIVLDFMPEVIICLSTCILIELFKSKKYCYLIVVELVFIMCILYLWNNYSSYHLSYTDKIQCYTFFLVFSLSYIFDQSQLISNIRFSTRGFFIFVYLIGISRGNTKLSLRWSIIC